MSALDDDLTTEAWESRVVPWAGIGAGPAAGSRWIGVSATAVVVEPGGWLPRGDGPEDAGLVVADGSEPLFIGVLGGEEVWAIDAVGHAEHHEPVDLMSLYGRTSERRWAVAGRAVQLVEWARTHRLLRPLRHRDRGGARRAGATVPGLPACSRSHDSRRR